MGRPFVVEYGIDEGVRRFQAPVVRVVGHDKVSFAQQQTNPEVVIFNGYARGSIDRPMCLPNCLSASLAAPRIEVSGSELTPIAKSSTNEIKPADAKAPTTIRMRTAIEAILMHAKIAAPKMRINNTANKR